MESKTHKLNQTLHNAHVIYVGDRSSSQQLFDNLLDLPIELRLEPNPFQAIRFIEVGHQRPKVFIADYNNNGISGIEFLADLKTNPNLNNPILILYANHVNAEIVESALQAGINEIVTPSTTTEELVSIFNNSVNIANLSYATTQTKKLNSSPGFLKRAFDILSSSIALLLLSPVLLITALLIKIESKGPIFYISKRVGADYKIFDFYKFRTMKVDSDSELDQLKSSNQYAGLHVAHTVCPKCKKQNCNDATLFEDNKGTCEYTHLKNLENESTSFVKISNDPRITRFGTFLRNSSIDELPQLINILLGDMSVVGNRPLPLYEAEQLTADNSIPRFLCPAGLTGLWQVTKRGKTDMSEEERIELDNQYAKNRSFFGDLKLIFQTLPVMVQNENV